MLKRLMLVMLAWLCVSSVADARERLYGYCMKGGYQVTTQGLKSTEYFQRTFRSCTIHVYVAGTTTLATLYSDNLEPASTPLANPFTSASDGYWEFYASAGRYDVQFTDSATSTQYTWGDLLACDPLGPNADTSCVPSTGETTHNLLSDTHLDTIPYTPPNVGDLIRGGLYSLWERFPIGQEGQVLTVTDSDSLLPNWVWPNTLDTCTSVQNNGSEVGCEHEINFIPGNNITYSMTDDSDNGRVNVTINGCATCGGGAASPLPDKFYTLLPDCSNGAFVGIEDITPIESYFSQTFDNFGAANTGESNCFVTYGTDTGVDQFAEVKEASGFLRNEFPWTVNVYIRFNDLTKERIWFGFTDSLSTSWQTADDPSIFASDVAMVRFSTTGDAPDPGAGDTTLHLVTMFNGAAATIHDTGVTPDTNTHKFQFSYDGASTVTLKMDGATIDTASGTYTDGHPMFWYISITSLDSSAAKYFSFYGLQIIEQDIHTGP